tara:strand:+ start:633 stop:899 length:267 start_codon:yes stop_codon:yes gene_type:complete
MPGGSEIEIRAACQRIEDLLVEKNRRYGDSALHPIRLFSSAAPDEQLRVRIDDKLSRLRSIDPAEDEDVLLDLIGYLVLLLVAQCSGD